ncbi:MAG TPA: hypothetical protein DDZ80_26450 [Cyanobacteria bacterium UBA8803]|nr:hypothetical protein [Cyanobacteria bacterium UBA9273]HBL61824.1 hypothetical protein [Cyanobacteria bacterium UBA8803]
MQLEGIPVLPENPDYLELLPTLQRSQIDLHLTIRFNEQWQPLREGRVKFGLKGGELRLKLENGEIPHESRQLAGSVELVRLTLEPESAKNKEPKKFDRLSRNSNSALVVTKASDRTPMVSGQPSDTTSLNQASVCHITVKVSEENPTWIFEEERGEPVLKGLLNKVKLATLTITAFPCRVEAIFEVSRRDICLTDAEGLWPPDLSRNKRAVLDRLIIQRLLEPQFQPYLSRAKLHYDG